MKALLLSTLFISTTSFAQSIDLPSLKQFMATKKDVLEKVSVGMTKKLTTLGKIQLQNGVCQYKKTSTQTIIKILDNKILIASKETFNPAVGPICQSAGYASKKETILYYTNRPSLSSDLSDLDITASTITSITRSGDIISLGLNISETDQNTGTTYSDSVKMVYDFSKPSFKNTLSIQGNDYKITSEDLADTAPSTFDLSNVLFCSDNDGDNSECSLGNYSDILF